RVPVPRFGLCRDAQVFILVVLFALVPDVFAISGDFVLRPGVSRFERWGAGSPRAISAFGPDRTPGVDGARRLRRPVYCGDRGNPAVARADAARGPDGTGGDSAADHTAAAARGGEWR